jgi:hypothetical protein
MRGKLFTVAVVLLASGLFAAAEPAPGQGGAKCKTNKECESKLCLGNMLGLWRGQCAQVDGSVTQAGPCSLNRECRSRVCHGNKHGAVRISKGIYKGECLEGVGTLGANAKCVRDAECQSGNCQGNREFSSGAAGRGVNSFKRHDGAGVCTAPDKSLGKGDPCHANDECVSSVCVHQWWLGGHFPLSRSMARGVCAGVEGSIQPEAYGCRSDSECAGSRCVFSLGDPDLENTERSRPKGEQGTGVCKADGSPVLDLLLNPDTEKVASTAAAASTTSPRAISRPAPSGAAANRPGLGEDAKSVRPSKFIKAAGARRRCTDRGWDETSPPSRDHWVQDVLCRSFWSDPAAGHGKTCLENGRMARAEAAAADRTSNGQELVSATDGNGGLLNTGDFGGVSLSLRLPLERADWYHALQNAIAEYIPSENCRPTIRARFCSLGCNGLRAGSVRDGSCTSLAGANSVGVLGGVGILSDAAFALEMKRRADTGQIDLGGAGAAGNGNGNKKAAGRPNKKCVSMRIMSTPPPRDLKQAVHNSLTATGYAWHVRELVRDKLGAFIITSNTGHTNFSPINWGMALGLQHFVHLVDFVVSRMKSASDAMDNGGATKPIISLSKETASASGGGGGGGGFNVLLLTTLAGYEKKLYSGRCDTQGVANTPFTDTPQAEKFQAFIDAAKQGKWPEEQGAEFKAGVDGILERQRAAGKPITHMGLFCTEYPLIFEEQALLEAKKQGRASMTWTDVVDEWWPGLFKAGEHGPGSRVFNSEHIFADAAVSILNNGLGKLATDDYDAVGAVSQLSKSAVPKRFDSCRRGCQWISCCHDQVCDEEHNKCVTQTAQVNYDVEVTMRPNELAGGR